MQRETTCCFTGHRPDKLPWGTRESDPRFQAVWRQLCQAVERAYAAGFRHFICGMARGCDLSFARAVLDLRNRHPEVTLEAARPCESQANTWPRRERQLYQELLDQCNFETLVQHNYDRACMTRRNHYMVDHSSRIISIYNGVPKGGTAQTLAYALKQNLTTDIIYLE